MKLLSRKKFWGVEHQKQFFLKNLGEEGGSQRGNDERKGGVQSRKFVNQIVSKESVTKKPGEGEASRIGGGQLFQTGSQGPRDTSGIEDGTKTRVKKTVWFLNRGSQGPVGENDCMKGIILFDIGRTGKKKKKGRDRKAVKAKERAVGKKEDQGRNLFGKKGLCRKRGV